jgi:hypothetical protein
MELLCNNILKNVFGNKCRLLKCIKIKEGFMNDSLKLICSEFSKPLFLKVEKPFTIPRTQKFQIKKETAGITLCKNAGIPVPVIIKSDENGNMYNLPWILEEFIDDKLICEYTLSEHNKDTLGIEFEDVFMKISSINNNYYGDTFLNGYIGNYSSWYETISQITKLLYEDCMEIKIFGDNADNVRIALNKALSCIKSNTPPVLFHCDLFSANIMGCKDNDNGEIHISYIIDFGMSLFAPIGYSQYQTRRLTDFKIPQIDVNKLYGMKIDELNAYEILRLEPVLLMNIFKYSDCISRTSEYIEKCQQYIL